MNRDEIIAAYAERIVDGMDMRDLVAFATEQMIDRLDSYDDEELVEEVREFAPDLLEDVDSFGDEA